MSEVLPAVEPRHDPRHDPRPDGAAGDAGPTHDPEAGTRRRVLATIASDGPLSASELAARLDLTSAAIRRHLGALEHAGRIAEHVAPRGEARRGRPARLWVVTAGGQADLSHRYSELAGDALRFLASTGGARAVEGFAEHRGAELERRLAGRLDGADTAERVEQLARALSDDGYAASARPVGAAHAVQLCQGHCPVQDVAHEFPQLCEAEARAFSRLLGVHVQRLATLAGGGHVCTTNIPLTPLTTPAPVLDPEGPTA